MGESEKEENSGLIKVGEYTLVKRKRGAISEFFNHMITYGGFAFNDGIMTVWGDTSFFIPLDGFVYYYHLLKKEVGKTADYIFFWLGHLYGRNSTKMLIKKFGFNQKKLSDFMNGATQDGFGFISFLEMNYYGTKGNGRVEGSNSNFSKRYAELFGVQTQPLDFYIMGILAGGCEPLFNLPVTAREEKCMGKGHEVCIYRLENFKGKSRWNFFKKIGLSEEDIRNRTEKLGQKRKINFKLFGKKNVKFGDGSFILKGHKGFNLASYELVFLDLITKKFLGNKKYALLKNKVAEEYVKGTFDHNLISKVISSKELKRLVEHLKIFGFGHLSIHRFQKGEIIIKNEENPYLGDQISLLGKISGDASDFLAKILDYSFKKYFGKEVKTVAIKPTYKETFFKIKL